MAERQVPSRFNPRVGVVLAGHGSRLPDWMAPLESLALTVRERRRFASVEVGLLSRSEPTLQTALEKIASRGVRRIVVVPVFLSQGAHVTKEIPTLISEVKANSALARDVEVIYAEPLGADRRLADIIEDRVEEALRAKAPQGALSRGDPNVPYATEAGSRIMEESLRIVRQKILEAVGGLSRPELLILERIVHATADVEYARITRISPRAAEAGVEAVSRGCTIVADVAMVKAGISREKLKGLGVTVKTYIDHPRTLRLARAEGITKSAAAMRLALRENAVGGIVAIGNAPTAALEAARAVERGEARPALIVATPVGFVGAAEAKEKVASLPTPTIVVRGPKGGSAVAAAVVNALLSLAQARPGESRNSP